MTTTSKFFIDPSVVKAAAEMDEGTYSDNREQMAKLNACPVEELDHRRDLYKASHKTKAQDPMDQAVIDVNLAEMVNHQGRRYSGSSGQSGPGEVSQGLERRCAKVSAREVAREAEPLHTPLSALPRD
jgi:hypothetical protein